MKKIIFGAILIAFSLSSCKKEDKNGGIAPGSYVNQTPGTTWNFKNTDSSTLTISNYTITSSASDTNVNGKTYHIYNRSNGGNQYLNVSGSDYYQFSSLGPGLGSFELRYLSDNAAVGNSWITVLTDTLSLNGSEVILNANVISIVEQKGSSISINGKTYNNVITMRTVIQDATIRSGFFSLPIVFSTQRSLQYYSPKYGLIKRITNIVASTTIPGNPPTNQELINTYTIDELMSSSIQ
jgi:hypothetical protein